MTLENSTERILAAVATQNFEALEAGVKQREAAMAAIASAPPTFLLRDAIAASLAAGEEAKRALRVLRQRMRHESRRLSNIEQGFVQALRPAPSYQVDCKG